MVESPTFYALAVGGETLDPYRRSLGLAPGRALEALVRTVAASPAWSALPGASALVCRPSPRPRLAVVGRFDAAAAASLEAQARGLRFACRHLRYADYPQVAADCQRLASRLIDRFGREELARRHFTAIPRGGLVVLGLLASLLGLDRQQLAFRPPTSRRPLVAVDDCALSGARSAEFLAEHGSRDVVFAHLYSHPRLRAAVEDEESRVTACVGARDLEECAPPPSEGRRRQAASHDRKTYWLGCPEALCLPWNEPDRWVWNPVTGRTEKAWAVVPAELCTKNRPAKELPALPVQVMPEAPGPLVPGEEVLSCDLGGRTLLGNLASGEVVALEGVARRIWRSLLRGGDRERVAGDLAREYEAPMATLRRDVSALVDDLAARGFLDRAGS